MAETRETTVNGVDVMLWSHLDNEHVARQAAAALPRGTDDIEVEEGVHDGQADLWFEAPNEGATFVWPDAADGLLPGWDIVNVSLHTEGVMCVRVRPGRQG